MWEPPPGARLTLTKSAAIGAPGTTAIAPPWELRGDVANRTFVSSSRTTKAALACVDCGEAHPATLDFHHVDPKEKERSLGDIGKYGWSRAKALAEIAKCVILCANCHRKRHWTASRDACAEEIGSHAKS